jgi:hypothetical protein
VSPGPTMSERFDMDGENPEPPEPEEDYADVPDDRVEPALAARVGGTDDRRGVAGHARAPGVSAWLGRARIGRARSTRWRSRAASVLTGAAPTSSRTSPIRRVRIRARCPCGAASTGGRHGRDDTPTEGRPGPDDRRMGSRLASPLPRPSLTGDAAQLPLPVRDVRPGARLHADQGLHAADGATLGRAASRHEEGRQPDVREGREGGARRVQRVRPDRGAGGPPGAEDAADRAATQRAGDGRARLRRLVGRSSCGSDRVHRVLGAAAQGGRGVLASDVLDDGRLVVRAGKRGPGEAVPRVRTVGVFGPGRGALLRQKPHVGRVWSWRTPDRALDKDTVAYDFRRLADEAGYSGSFHGLRHHCATWLQDRGASPEDIAVQLGHVDRAGHANPRLVRRVYSHPDAGEALSRLDAVATLAIGS